MRVVVHFEGVATEIGPARANGDAETTFGRETWGRLCQRFVETMLPHPPRLLKLLTKLSPEGRTGGYRFRYGDGNSTLIKPLWSELIDNGRDIVEANVTLRPRDGMGDQNVIRNLPMLGVGSDLERRAREGSTEGDERWEVDLCVEKVGDNPHGNDYSEENREVDLGGKKVGEYSDDVAMSMAEMVEKIGEDSHDDDGGNDENMREDSQHDNGGDGAGGQLGFAMTQTPLPIDINKARVLFVREHPRFEGVVDAFSIESAADCADGEAKKKWDTWSAGAAVSSSASGSSPVSGAKRRARPAYEPVKRRALAPARRTKSYTVAAAVSAAMKSETAAAVEELIGDLKHEHDDGRLRRVPPGWIFPKLPLGKMYVYWHCGDPVNEIPPIKRLEPGDVDHLGDRAARNLRDIAKVIRVVDGEARARGAVPDSTSAAMSQLDAERCYLMGECVIEDLIASVPAENRPKHNKGVSQTMCSGIVKYLGKNATFQTGLRGSETIV
mmetsp:Transcript_56715/g.120420  ORF Transcript_56715/g.120420 Transcript_56715/m.120420 type:complete len:497 (+) Transcript_56715:152-1642(+)